MQEIEKIIAFFTGEKILIGIAIGIIVLLERIITNINHVENLYDFIKVKRKKLIREDISDNNLENGIREILKEKLNSLVFKEIFKFNANEKLRNSIYSLLKNTEISIIDIKKSIKYIDLDNNILFINLTSKDKTLYKADKVLHLVFLFSSIFYFLIFITIIAGLIKGNQPKDMTSNAVSIISLIGTFLYAIISYFYRKKIIAYETAQKLRTTLSKLNQN